MNGRSRHHEFIESVVDRGQSDSFRRRGWAAVVRLFSVLERSEERIRKAGANG